MTFSVPHQNKEIHYVTVILCSGCPDKDNTEKSVQSLKIHLKYSESRILWHSLVKVKLSPQAGGNPTCHEQIDFAVICHYRQDVNISGCHNIRMSLHPGFVVIITELVVCIFILRFHKVNTLYCADSN